MIERPTPNFDSRDGGRIDLVVLHYTGMQDAETALRRLCDPAPVAGAYPGPWQAPDIDPATPLGRASAHYVVSEQGEVWRLVDETQRAWHAGKSLWEGRDDTNARSIGIEIVNGGHDFGLPPFPDAQIEAVIGLARDILARHDLQPHRVVGHSDVAPARKQDPGERFPWRRLAAAGVSIWPEAGGGDTVVLKPGAHGEAVHDLHAALAEFGYGAPEDASPYAAMFGPETEAIVRAFQRRFEPHRIDGLVRKGTLRALEALNEEIAARDDD
jgi:N-acetylmuramoyl-L-alanine amidase